MFGDFRGFFTMLGVALLVGITGGYFVGKKFGGGWGTLAGFGIMALTATLLGICRPCRNGFNSLYSGRNKPRFNENRK